MRKEHAALSVQEATLLLGISAQTIRRLYASKQLRGYRKTAGKTSAIMLYTNSVRNYIVKIQKRQVADKC